MTLSTAPINGSRFLDPFDDSEGSEDYYTPRHLRAVSLSPELQRALDEAFSPEDAPRPARLALVEPAADAIAGAAEPEVGVEAVGPARAVEASATVSVPEPPVVDPVATEPESSGLDAVGPEAVKGVHVAGRPLLALVIPETIVLDPVMAADFHVSEPEPEPIVEPEVEVEPVEAVFVPEVTAPEVTAPEPVPPPVAAAPSGPSGFPDPAAYAARRFTGGLGSAPSLPGSLFRRKVDPSRLLVPETQGQRS